MYIYIHIYIYMFLRLPHSHSQATHTHLHTQVHTRSSWSMTEVMYKQRLVKDMFERCDWWTRFDGDSPTNCESVFCSRSTPAGFRPLAAGSTKPSMLVIEVELRLSTKLPEDLLTRTISVPPVWVVSGEIQTIGGVRPLKRTSNSN